MYIKFAIGFEVRGRCYSHVCRTVITDASSGHDMYRQSPTYRRVMREINHRYDSHFDSIRHIDKKWHHNLIEGETIRTIKRGHIHYTQPGVSGEIQFISAQFGAA